MNQNRSVADARYKKLRALIGQDSPGGGGATSPLTRFRFIDGGTAETLFNGAIGEPYKTIGQFCAAFAGSASVADANALVVGELTPAIGGYAENPAFPGYRSIELRCQSFAQLSQAIDSSISGNATWANVAGGATHVPTLATLLLHNVGITGSLTVTDDGHVPGALYLSGDEIGVFGTLGSLDAHTTTALGGVSVQNYAILGACNLGHAATSATLLAFYGAAFNGAVTALSVGAIGAQFGAACAAINVHSTATFYGCLFAAGTGIVLTTDTAGSFISFDGPSYLSFVEAGGTVAGGGIVVVVGGYKGAAVEVAALPTAPAAPVLVSINGTGASAGFTGGGNHYQSTGLTGNATVQVLNGGGEHVGDTVRITKTDLAAHTLTVENNAGTTIAVIPSADRGFVELQRVGATAYAGITNDWALAGCGSLVS